MTTATRRPTGAVVGAGAMGQKYVQVLQDMPIDIVAIAGRTRERAQGLASGIGAAVFVGYEALLEEVRPDILFVCTPTNTHFDIIRLAVQQGVGAIYCEKPLAEDLAQARRIAELVTESGTLFGIGFKMRYEAVFAQAKELIRQDEIGVVLATQFTYFQTVPDWANWYVDSGAIKELLAHPIDLTNWFMDRPPHGVSCASYSTLGGAAEDRALITVNYGGHLNAQVTGGWIRDYPELPGRKHNICFQIVGERGYLLGMRPDLLHLRATRSAEFRPEPVDPFPLELAEFLDCYRRGAPVKLGLREGLHAQSIINGALESARTGRPVACEAWGGE